jgi:hypothetical protein
MVFLEAIIPRDHVLTHDNPPSWCKSIKPLIQLLNLTKAHPTLFCVVCYRRKCNPMEKVAKNVLFICFKCSTNNHVISIMFVMWPCASFCGVFWMTIHANFIQVEHPFLGNELILIFNHPQLCTPFIRLKFLWVPYSFFMAHGSNKWKH